MTVQSPPFALQNGSHSAALFRQASTSFIGQAGVVNRSELVVTGTGSMAVTVAAGRAWIPGNAVSNISGQAFSVQGDYFALNDAPVTVTLATSDPTNPRIDSVYVAINDSFYSGALNTAVVGVVTGTPAVTPAAPPIPTNALLLATVAVAANTTVISSGNVTDKRVLFGQSNSTRNGATSVGTTTQALTAATLSALLLGWSGTSVGTGATFTNGSTYTPITVTTPGLWAFGFTYYQAGQCGTRGFVNINLNNGTIAGRYVFTGDDTVSGLVIVPVTGTTTFKLEAYTTIATPTVYATTNMYVYQVAN